MAGRSPYGLVLPPIDEATLQPSVFGERNQWETLGQSLASGIDAAVSTPMTVAVRPDDVPHLAVLGRASSEEQDYLEEATDSLSRLRYVSYDQAEEDCGVLAKRLRERLPSGLLEKAVFTGIPRGGLIVLGMVSYALQLSQEQLFPKSRPSAPLVVVDDCFLTGARVARFLQEKTSRSKIILVGLYAHPDLCSALEREISVVRACVTARKLKDHAPNLYGSDYSAWRARWEARDTDLRYWIGIPDHLCFAWSEPDVGMWNSQTETTERAWDIVPEERCLDRRFKESSASPSVYVQQFPSEDDSSRSIQPGTEVFYAEVEDETIVAHGPLDTCLALDGTAADFWWTLIKHGEIDAARQALLARYDVEPDVLEADLHDFVEAMVERHLLGSPGFSSVSS